MNALILNSEIRKIGLNPLRRLVNGGCVNPEKLLKTPFRAAVAGLLLLLLFGARTAIGNEVITVAADGSGNFKTIQAALDSVANENQASVIQIAPGRYPERVTVAQARNFITLRGMGRTRSEVVIAGGAGKWGVLSALGDDLRVENLTVENTSGPAAGPQMALFCQGKRQVFENVLIKGWQDTLGSWNGNLAYFHHCEIQGSVDFIYSGGTAVFDQCDVVQIRDVGGVLTAPSTPAEMNFGLVFLNCRLLKAAGVAEGSTTLMRPWRADGHAAFINCAMDNHISSQGWSEWDGREKTCRAVEFGSKTLEGKPIDLSQRASWAKILSPRDAEQYSVTNVLGGWNPVGDRNRAVVASDGSGDFVTIQEAIAAVPDNNSNAFTIVIQPGKYTGPFMIGKEKHHVRLIGTAPEKTILTWPYNVYEPQSSNTYQFNPGLVVVGNHFYAENLTIENTSGDHGQALAVRVDGDCSMFNHCRILGWQDTLMANNGRHYFTNCFIAGRVDFIYGSGTAVFDHCEIQSRNGGYITAANTPPDQAYGFVFLNCKLTGDPTPWPNPAGSNSKAGNRLPLADLGRPWRPYASVTYINCEMGDHIKPAGWDNWRRVDNEATARYAEYHSSGPGGRVESRVKWAKQLTDAEAERFTIENILGGADHWQPLQ